MWKKLSSSSLKYSTDELKTEIKRLLFLSIPLIVSYACSYFMRLFTVIFVGQYLSTDDFDAIVIGNTMTNITGYSMIIAFVSPMDTLCTQAYGAKNWKLFSITIQRAIICCTIFLIPIIILWYYIYDILMFFGYNQMVANNAFIYAMVFISNLPALIAMEVTRRFLSSQELAQPLLYIGAIFYMIWHPVSLFLVFSYFGTRNFIFAPLCIVVTTYLNIICIIIYCMMRKRHNPLSLQKVPFSMIFKWETNWKQDTFISKHIDDKYTNIDVIDKGLKDFVVLSIAGMFTICAEWWSFEIVTFLAGMLGPTQLAVHVIYVTVLPFCYMFPIGIGLAAAARVGALIGENRQYLAKRIGELVLLYIIFEAIIFSVISWICRGYIPLLFTKNVTVIDITIKLNPLYCGMIFVDAIQGVMAGILRGMKQQTRSIIGVVIGAWLVTIPLSILLAFDKSIDLKVFGIWIGFDIGYLIMDIIFLYIFLIFKWDKSNNNIKNNKDKMKFSSSLSISHFSAFLGVSALTMRKMHG